MPNLTDGERCTRRSSRAYPQENRRFGLLTEQEAHESRAARRPEGSRAMKPETRDEIREIFKEGWPIFLTNFLGGMLIGYVLNRLG